MAKKRVNFYTPARVEGWYRATPDPGIQRMLDQGLEADKPVYHVPGEKRAGLGQVFNGPDHYNLMLRVANASQGARRDMARLFVTQITAKPERTEALLKELAASLNEVSEQLWDSLEFHAGRDEERPLKPAPAIASPDMDEAEHSLMVAMATANMVRDRAFADGQELHFGGRVLRPEITHIDATLPIAKTALAMAANEREHGPKSSKATAIEGFATAVNPSMLVRALDSIPVHYGGPDNWIDGPTRAESKARMNAVHLAMRHWDEINADGRYNGGISVGQGNLRALPASVVESIGVRMTDQADFDAMRSRPKAGAAATATATPRRP